ncbi:MAG TPA: MerR family transcriptional regulator [Agriterribacter sp.]|nr:MerR family transcriptional regulator [Agriterribacter sp.]
MYKQLDLFASLNEAPPPKPVPRLNLQELQPPVPMGEPEVDEVMEEASISSGPTDIVNDTGGPVSLRKGKRGRKSIREMDAESDRINVPDDDILFKKQYYSIGAVAAMFNLNTSLLRYWETEFDILKPRKNRKGDRHFRPEDIKNLKLIHHLLRKRKYTIEGAKSYLKKNKSGAQQNFDLIQRLEKLKGFLLELKAGL